MSQPTLRWLGLSAGALLLNLLILALMAAMAARAPKPFKSIADTLTVDFVRLKKTPPPPKPREREKPKPPEPKPTPQKPALKTATAKPRPTAVAAPSVAIPNLNVPLKIQGAPMPGDIALATAPAASTDLGDITEAVPLSRTPPLYPPRALARRIEGRVKVLFTVTEDGSVADPEVIESKPSGVFDRAALRAIQGWKFQKKTVGGQPVRWQSVQTIIFQLKR